MEQRDFEILIAHAQILVPPPGPEPLAHDKLTTLLANLTHYGYSLTLEGFQALQAADEAAIDDWWIEVEGALMELTGDSKNLAEHVVYKNFPAEVLALSELDYWYRQIMMYWGLPNELFTTDAKPRQPLDVEEIQLKVLQLGNDDSLASIYRSLLRRPARWTPGQWSDVAHLAKRFHETVAPRAVPFKENQMALAALFLDWGQSVELATATDVLRLAVAMSDGDVSLRENSPLRRFTRAKRRALLGMLEAAPALAEDVARRRERFKRLLRELHPGDYASRFPRVAEIYDVLYRGAPIETFNSRLEARLATADPAALDQLAERPGEFVRRLIHTLTVYGPDATQHFARILPKLSTLQLLKIGRQLETRPGRRFRTFPPRGNWTRLQIRKAPPARRLPLRELTALAKRIRQTIGSRVEAKIPSVRLDPRTEWVRLQTNDSDLTPYGRGTVFPIPKNINFLRTASYWESGPTPVNLWYDNGWNFFDARWKPLGVCCWSDPKFCNRRVDGAIFSGDPTNFKDPKGRGTQLIDLYLDQLVKMRVRYAVWNLLCYSHKTFDDAEEVYAALQWGGDAQSGELFEPARCQLSFPVRGDNLTKYIAYLDVKERHLVYLDANLYSRVRSAKSNQKILAGIMPAFVEYLETLPTVHDLFRAVPPSDDGLPVVYDDTEIALDGETAYVFRPLNPSNSFESLDPTALLE